MASSSAVSPETPRLPAGDAAAVRPVASTRKFGAAASSFSQVVGPFIAGSRKTQVAVLVLRDRAAAAVHLDSLALLPHDYRRIVVPPPVPSPCPADESDWPRRPKTWIGDQGSTMRGCGGDSSGTVGVSCMAGSYLSQSTSHRARRRERSASFGSKPRGAVACFGVCVDLCCVVHLLAGPPWRPNGRQGSGFDSPWQGGGGTTSLRAPAVAKLLVHRGGPGVR